MTNVDLNNAKPLVYLRPLKRGEIVSGDYTVDRDDLVALNDENGRSLAIFDDVWAAKAAAQEHELTLVTRH